MFHAEAPDVLQEASEKLKTLIADPTQYQTFLNSRPGLFFFSRMNSTDS